LTCVAGWYLSSTAPYTNNCVSCALSLSTTTLGVTTYTGCGSSSCLTNGFYLSST